MAASTETLALSGRPPSQRMRLHSDWFTGLTWRGMGLVAMLSLINGARRTSRYLDGETPLTCVDVVFLEWVIRTGLATLFGLIVAVPAAIAVVVTYNLTRQKALWRYPALAMAVVTSCTLGVDLMFFVESGTSRAYLETESLLNPFLVAIIRYGLLCAMVAVVFVYLRAASESAARAQGAERDRMRFVQRMQEARLKMLQAQIEPHFLFNTLANVRGLYETEPSKGERMLDDLMRYFEAALPQMRAADSTLGREVALTSAYLAIQQIRMGRRLAFDIEVAELLRHVSFPPLMVLTLAENAIKHGLAPLPEGGAIRVTAMECAGELQVRVADSGGGFTQSSGGGTGLANIRARLTAMYGDAGRLSLTRNAPRGVVATIVVPLSAMPPTVASA